MFCHFEQKFQNIFQLKKQLLPNLFFLPGGHSFNVRQPQAVGIPRTVCVRQLRLAVGRESTSRWYLDLICHQVPQKGKSRPYWIPGTWLSGEIQKINIGRVQIKGLHRILSLS